MSIEQIAYNIKFFREQNGWSQQELADRLHISRSVVTKWETNAAVPDVSSLIKLATLFGVSLDHIAGIHSFRDDLLKEFKRIYHSEEKPFDEDIVDLVEYLMMHPNFKNEIHRLKQLSVKKQLSIHHIVAHLINEYERL